MIKKNRQIKEAKVAEIKEKLEKAQGVVLADYQGLSVEEDTMLRKSLREAGVEYKVYKNTLVTLAANELGLGDLVQYLEGPVSIAFGYEDATAPARVLNDVRYEISLPLDFSFKILMLKSFVSNPSYMFLFLFTNSSIEIFDECSLEIILYIFSYSCLLI